MRPAPSPMRNVELTLDRSVQQFKGDFAGMGIDDRGEIWVDAFSGNSQLPDVSFLQTPYGFAPPTAAPEPSSVMIRTGWHIHSAQRPLADEHRSNLVRVVWSEGVDPKLTGSSILQLQSVDAARHHILLRSDQEVARPLR